MLNVRFSVQHIRLQQVSSAICTFVWDEQGVTISFKLVRAANLAAPVYIIRGEAFENILTTGKKIAVKDAEERREKLCRTV